MCDSGVWQIELLPATEVLVVELRLLVKTPREPSSVYNKGLTTSRSSVSEFGDDNLNKEAKISDQQQDMVVRHVCLLCSKSRCCLAAAILMNMQFFGPYAKG
nr:hypothetical protein [Tanacetum cinerariifolium]